MFLPRVQLGTSVFGEGSVGLEALTLAARVRGALPNPAGTGQAGHVYSKRQLGLQTFRFGSLNGRVEEKLRPGRGLKGFPTLSPGLGPPVLEPHLEEGREAAPGWSPYTPALLPSPHPTCPASLLRASVFTKHLGQSVARSSESLASRHFLSLCHYHFFCLVPAAVSISLEVIGHPDLCSIHSAASTTALGKR